MIRPIAAVISRRNGKHVKQVQDQSKPQEKQEELVPAQNPPQSHPIRGGFSPRHFAEKKPQENPADDEVNKEDAEEHGAGANRYGRGPHGEENAHNQPRSHKQEKKFLLFPYFRVHAQFPSPEPAPLRLGKVLHPLRPVPSYPPAKPAFRPPAWRTEFSRARDSPIRLASPGPGLKNAGRERPPRRHLLSRRTI